MTIREARDICQLTEILGQFKRECRYRSTASSGYEVFVSSPLNEQSTLRTYTIAMRWLRREFAQHPLLKREQTV